ncbi:hypothetical protein EUX98_g3681 [Antrodiella citrinella]|uniref:Protein kinase domain-containing protein n=1 Tax=Antrodiella citrinella TaxID=2447956 RepID=A0A4S4MY13_9APHY|nr:hypothetical protein EUX98_g3681 [Antrodiella citrinella]
MTRHTRMLYPHQNHEAESDVEDKTNHSRTSSVAGSNASSSTTHTSPPKSGPKLYSPDSKIDSNNSRTYDQFVRRLQYLLDGADSDEEGAQGLSNDVEGLDRRDALMPDSAPAEPQTTQERERLEWQAMLASVLAGDILRAEKGRIAVALKSFKDRESTLSADLWLGIQAKLHGMTEAVERKRIDERRLRTVDAACKEVLEFYVTEPSPTFVGTATDNALSQVKHVLHRLDIAYSLYPSLRAFHMDYTAASTIQFQRHCDALNTWCTVLTSLRQNIHLLRKWTGNENLDVLSPTVFPATRSSGEGDGGTPFVERLLKEESVQRHFEKGSMTTIHALVGTTRAAHVNLGSVFEYLNLPLFEEELVPLITFLTSLAQAVLRVQLAYAQKLRNPDILILDQMMEDLKVKIGFACALKRQYEAFLIPDPGGHWMLPPCISDDYDSVILQSLTFFFKLVYWKLKSGLRSIYYKETDTIEAQWATFSDVSSSVPGGPSLVAEELSSLTTKLIGHITNYFDTQVLLPLLSAEQKRKLRDAGLPAQETMAQTAFEVHMDSTSSDKPISDDQLLNWYAKILEGVKHRYRKLQRLSRVLNRRFSNSAEYDIKNVPIDYLISALVDADHCLVYTSVWEEDGTFIIVHPSLRGRPGTIQRILMEAFHVTEADEDMWLMDTGNSDPDSNEEASYVLVLSQTSQFVWNGPVLMLDIPKFDLKLSENRIRLIADGPLHRLTLAKTHFTESLLACPLFDEQIPCPCLVESRAHLPFVNHELKKMNRATAHLAESVINSVLHVRDALRQTKGYQELLQNWFRFASEHGKHSQKHMNSSSLDRFGRLLLRLDISWVTFICDDCAPNEHQTFRWAVAALEFTLHRTQASNVYTVSNNQFNMLRQKVATCMTLITSQFDLLEGGHAMSETKRGKKRREEILRQIVPAVVQVEALLEEDTGPSFTDPAVRVFWNRTRQAVRELEILRARVGTEQNTVGKVLDEERLVDRSLLLLAGSRANITIRWQQGRFIGAGSFGSVYLAVNLDSGSLMAAKEIKFQALTGLSSIYTQIKEELAVMELLHHPNVVEFYGIEVHRDKVFIFEEYCQCGSLASLLETGRIEDENITQVYTMQLLEGLVYLHSEGVLHRDIKPSSECYSRYFSMIVCSSHSC